MFLRHGDTASGYHHPELFTIIRLQISLKLIVSIKNMKLKRALPPSRSFASIMNQYLVEREIADRLRNANREERKSLYATMYDELFCKVPDHPRLIHRESEQLTLKANSNKFNLIRDFVSEEKVFVEFAPGDCKFAMDIAHRAKFVYGIDISDQRDQELNVPPNFKLIIYDGYRLEEISKDYIDTIFSDQLIEHFHPEDTELHFNLCQYILKRGGRYVFRTPHLFSGPHDVSVFFSDEPQCFHLKEWTYSEIGPLLKRTEFSEYYALRMVKGRPIRLPYIYFVACEKMLVLLPRKIKKFLSSKLLGPIVVVAIK